MIDPIVSLAFAVYSNKGAYALLLGSGVSRASSIPTGWEIVLDLIRKVAKVEGADCGSDPAQWFKAKYSSEPDYSKLLDQIPKTSTERQQLLRGYFEPTDEERNQGLKLPSAAHKAIARMASMGYLRVIVTTNFDRLMERALEDVGITPTVINNTDQIAGALPLVHSGVTIIKLHGDYLDTRIKNTEGELVVYEKSLNELLDRIFDEYGLIICGWSGDWDFALRAAIERCPNRRFSTFWTVHSKMSTTGKALAEHRKALLFQIRDADHLFQELDDKIQSLESIAAPHPLSAKMAVATVKRYLVDPAAKIRLYDLVHEETRKLFIEINSPKFRSLGNFSLVDRVEKYDSACEVLMSIFITAGYWATEEPMKIWTNSLQTIGTSQGEIISVYRENAWRYPVLLLFYAAGIASVVSENYKFLFKIFTKAKIKDNEFREVPFCSALYPGVVIDSTSARQLPGMSGRHTPLNDYIYSRLKTPLSEYVSREEDYQMAFDKFEYLLALGHADFNRIPWVGNQQSAQKAVTTAWWSPIGRFGWRNRGAENFIAKKIDDEIKTEGQDWAPLKAGLFGGNLEQLKIAQTNFNNFLSQVWYH